MLSGCRARPLLARQAAGFTLIEMMVALVVIALVIGVVPRLAAAVPSVRLRAAADELVSVLKDLHAEAIRRGGTTELVLDPAARLYRVSTEAMTRRLPSAIEDVGFKSPAVENSQKAARVQFFADGSSSGGTIVLRHGTHSQGIGIDWLTGRVRRYE
jgi:general secretion pathway protein H